MIRYHGTPITPSSAGVEILTGRHGLVSFYDPRQLEMVAEVCHSFILDNGSFSHWKQGKGTIDVKEFAQWVIKWHRHPGFDFCFAPDVIDGTEKDNDDMMREFHCRITENLSNFLGRPKFLPIWHLGESLGRLKRLVGVHDHIALGSSGEYAEIGTDRWEYRMNDVFELLCDNQGRPLVKVHGLRMMSPTIFSRYPFSSVDSANIARNMGIDKEWDRIPYLSSLRPSDRAVMMAKRCETHASAKVWVPSREKQFELLMG